MKTRISLFIMLLFSFAAFSQETTDATIDKGSGILYFSAKPGTTPVNPDTYSVSEFAMNTAANPPELWVWNRTSASWERQFAISQGDTIPTTAPSAGKPYIYFRTGTTPAIYLYKNSAWSELGTGGGGGGTDDQTAVEVPFTPTGNILSSDVQSMGEELQTQIDGLQTTSGVVNGATNLGTFSGSTISDNTTTKTALQELETAVENVSGGGVSDGDKGDITVSVSGATWTIDNSAISTDKIEDDAVTADKLANTAVTAGSYTSANITVDAQGRITAASSGSGGGGGGNTDDQTISFVGTTLSIEDANSVDLSSLQDATQVADLTALTSSSFPIGTLVTVQSNGATYKIESSVPATWNSGTVDGTVALNDANNNVVFLQTINGGNLYLASHLGFDPTGVVDGGEKARTLMPLLSEYEHGIYWDDGATFLLKTRDKASINNNPANANILSIDYDNFLWVGSGNEDTQAILDFRVADDIDNMLFPNVVGLYFNTITESVNNFTIDGVHIRGDQRLVHNDNTDLFVRTIVYMIKFASPVNESDRGEGFRFKNNKFSKFHSFASASATAIIKDVEIINNEWDDWGYDFGLAHLGRRVLSESVTLDMPINTYTFSEIADNVHIRFHDGEGNNYGIINYNEARNLTDIDQYGEITDWNNTETVTWDISNATTDYTDATKVTVTISRIEDLIDIDDNRLDGHPSSCIDLPPSRDVKILNNRFYDMGNTQYDHIIYIYRSCENLVISGNMYYNFDDTRMKNSGGIHIRGGEYKNVVISNNIFHNDGDAIFSLGAIDNVEIYDNVLINDFYSSNFATAQVFMFIGTRNVKATNNILRSVIEKSAITFSQPGSIRTNENIYLHDNYFENVQSLTFTESMYNVELKGNTYVATMGQDFGYDLLLETGNNTDISLRLLNEQFELNDPVNHTQNSIFAGFSGLTIKNPSFINEKQTLSLGNSSHALTNSKTQGLNEYSSVSVSSNSNVLNLDSYTVTDNTPQTLDLSRSLSMNDLSVAGETVINREVTLTGAANTSNNNSTVYRNETILQTDALTNKKLINTNDILTISPNQSFDLQGEIINYKNLFSDRSAVSTSNVIAADYTYQKDRAGGTASNGVALKATAKAQNGTITNAKALDINVIEQNGTNTNAIGIQINDIQGTTEYAIKQDGADDLNQFAGQVTIQNVLNLAPILGANAPASPSEGDVIIVSDTATTPFTTAGMYLYLGGAWAKL